MGNENQDGKIIQSYKVNENCELHIDKRKLIKAYRKEIAFCIILIIFYLFLLLTKMINEKIINIYFLSLLVTFELGFLLIIFFNYWSIRFENNTIIIKKGFLPEITIHLDNLINIQIMEYRNKVITMNLEVSYLNGSRFRKINLPYFKDMYYIIEQLEIEKFVKLFSHELVDFNDSNREWKNIYRDIETIEQINKKLSIQGMINKEATIKDIVVISIVFLIGFVLLFFAIPIIYKMIHGI